MTLAGKRILVTGGGTGTGADLARGFAAAGASVVITGVAGSGATGTDNRGVAMVNSTLAAATGGDTTITKMLSAPLPVIARPIASPMR